LWDWASGKLKETITWTHDELAHPSNMIYTASFSTGTESEPKEPFILAGAAGRLNEVKLFSTDNYKVDRFV
jgi:hypothetical protein